MTPMSNELIIHDESDRVSLDYLDGERHLSPTRMATWRRRATTNNRRQTTITHNRGIRRSHHHLPFTRPYTFWVCCQVASTTGSLSIRSSDSRCGSRLLAWPSVGGCAATTSPFACTFADMTSLIVFLVDSCKDRALVFRSTFGN